MGGKNFTSRDKQAQETKKRIFSVASQLIIKNGFENVTLEEISKKAGIAKGLFYHYYKSKADLVVETYGIIDDNFEKDLEGLDINASPIDKILFTVFTMARYAKGFGADFVRQIYKGQLDAGTNFFINKQRLFQKTIQDSIVTGQKQSLIRKDIEPGELAHFMMIVARGVLYDWCLHKGKYDLEIAMETYFRKIIFPKNKSK
jgi:TetR/AcrR family fatty acid metabolism transcriptional regulator